MAVATPKKVGRPVGKRSKMFGLPVREAEDTLTIPLLQVDIEEAQKAKTDDVNSRANFLACVIAQGVSRVCGAERVAILRSVAYVAYPGDKRTLRYKVDEKSRAVLEMWDRGEPVLEGVVLRLRAPGKNETRARNAKRRRDYRKTQPKGVGDKLRKTDRKQAAPDPLHGVVRNGNLVRWS